MPADSKPSAPTRLVLIRHGESVATVDRRISGYRTCAGLSDLGRSQSSALAARFAAEGFAPDVLISSNLRRAIETAEIVAPAIGATDLIEDPGFGEHDPGPECDGMSFAEFTQTYGEREWDDPFASTFPGGETVAEFHLRVGTALHRLLRAHSGETIAISCHGGVVDAVFRILLRLPSTGGFRLHTLNTALTELQLVPVWGGGELWQLNRYNDTDHLVGLPPRTSR